MTKEPLGPLVKLEVLRVEGQEAGPAEAPVATEVPLTIAANGIELATLMCTPSDLEALCHGFLLSSGVIQRAEDVQALSIDRTRWEARVQVRHDPDPALLSQRLFTSGCGRGVVYASAVELAARHPIRSTLSVEPAQIAAAMKWMQRSSELFRLSGGVHTAALSVEGAVPSSSMDDVGRHNAVDKVVGDAMMRGIPLDRSVLLSSGRTSSDMLHKAKRAGIAISVSRGAPTHQAVLQARAMDLTLIGFARGTRFTVYSHPERIVSLPA